MSGERMMSVWEWVGLVLMSYGLIITFTGFYLLFVNWRGTVLAHLHPNLWWGGFMFFSGAVLFLLSRRVEGE